MRKNEIAQAPKKWVPRPEWDALVRGKDCPLCGVVKSKERANEYGYTIADLGLSRLRLAANQFVCGYCILICAKHVCEPYELSASDQAVFFEDMMLAARALTRVFSPIKMNYEILGNAIPHLHCHLKPRYYGDPAPGSPISPDLGVVRLTPEEYAERAVRIRTALK